MDSEGDGASDLAEYVADTDPTSAASKFQVFEIRHLSSLTSIRFGPVNLSRRYTIFSCPNLSMPDWQSIVRDYQGHNARLDLKALIRRQVEGQGVSSRAVSSVNLCTICHDELFYSYRREGRVNGTMVSGITLVSSR